MPGLDGVVAMIDANVHVFILSGVPPCGFYLPAGREQVFFPSR